MSDSSNIKKIAISYAWAAEAGGSHAGRVEELCLRLRASGTQVLRDVDGAKPGDNLAVFMREVGNSEVVCVFLTDAYLRSANCMYELLVAWQTCKSDPGKFREKVRVWVTPDAKGIFSSEGRNEYLNFWKKIRAEEEAHVQQSATDGLSPDSLAKYKRVKEYCEHLDEILNALADTIVVVNFDDLYAWLERDVPALKGPTENQILAVYEETIQAMDLALYTSLAVARFLCKSTAGLVEQQGQQIRVADKARRPPVDVIAPFKSLEAHLKTEIVNFQSSDLDQLELICGGIMVMGVNPRWIWEQRNLADPVLRFPGFQQEIDLGEQSADFLHVVTSAMADGCVRLRRLFKEEPRSKEENRDLPQPPQRLQATMEDEREIELMAHFVNNLRKTKVDVSKPAEVKLAFAQIQANMSFESINRHNPYYGCGDAFFEHAARIRKFLSPQDFLIIAPSGEHSEDDLLPRSVWALRHLQDIHDQIKRRRGQLVS